MKKITLAIFIYLSLFSATLFAVTDCNDQQILSSSSCGGDSDERIIELYSAYFNRVADKEGIDHWTNSYKIYFAEVVDATITDTDKEDYALQKIAFEIALSEEYSELYPPTQPSTEFIETIYTNLLGRNSDAPGSAFWSNHIDNMTMSKELAILKMIAGAKANSTDQGLTDSALIANKTSLSKYFSETLASNSVELAKTAFAAITHEAASIVTAKGLLDLVFNTETVPTTDPIDQQSNGDNTSTLSAEQQAVLDYHNKVRADVNVKPLIWSDKITQYAHAWAEHLAADNCGFEHRKNSDYGENLFKGTLGAYDMVSAAKAWESEKSDYSGEVIDSSNYQVVGHYTQMVWNDTTEVGCATASCDNNLTVVCNYNPPGNYLGKKPY